MDLDAEHRFFDKLRRAASERQTRANGGMRMKYAVVYFSLTGETEKIARAIAERFGAELFPVEPQEDYGGFARAVARVVAERLRGKSPAAKTPPRDFTGYDVVFIGFPVWAGTMPAFMQDYIRACRFGKQTVIPFVTAAGTGKLSALQTVGELLPGASIEHYYFTSKPAPMDAQAWLSGVAAELAEPKGAKGE